MTTPEPLPVGVSDIVTMYGRGIPKTPAAVRNALGPAQRERFESEYRAADTLDLEPVLTLVQRTWWVRAVMCLNPEILDGVAADVNRVAAGDESVLADEGR